MTTKLPKMGGKKIVATKLPKLEYILYSFPIKPNILISHIESMSWILFCVFISPSCYKRQHVPSLFALHLLTESYIFHIVSLTSNCSLLYYSSALLQCAQLRIVSFGLMWVFLLCFINTQKLTDLLLLYKYMLCKY